MLPLYTRYSTLCVKQFYITLYLNRFRGKPAIPSLIGLSPLTTIHPSILLIHGCGPQKKYKNHNFIIIKIFIKIFQPDQG